MFMLKWAIIKLPQPEGLTVDSVPLLSRGPGGSCLLSVRLYAVAAVCI